MAETTGIKDQLRKLGRDWAKAREIPCLLFVSRSIVTADLLAVRRALEGMEEECLDVLVASPGGDIAAAYLIARELRRRFERVTAIVPFRAKSAATLICLGCDEIVMGSLGELGPLDEQVNEKQAADFPLNTSRLVPSKSLAQLQQAAVDTFESVAGRILEKSGMRPFDACTKAAELTTSLYAALYAQIDPSRLGESARALETGSEYAVRILRRYRSEIDPDQAKQIVHRLVHGYPSHGFVIDLEEAQDLTLPVRPGKEAETPILEELAMALIEFGIDEDLIELAGPPPGAIESAQAVLKRMPGQTRGRSRKDPRLSDVKKRDMAAKRHTGSLIGEL